MATALTSLDGPGARRWFEHALRSLLLVRGEVDRLNVFPVPDTDTGTNLVLTLAAAAEATREMPADAGLGALVRRAADGALLGARGGSGVIVSQALQAMAMELADREAMDGPVLAAALRSAAVGARSAVGDPAEGTILTVADAAAAGAQGALAARREQALPDGAERTRAGGPDRAPLADVAREAVRSARAALATTRGSHGGASVDAGAAGYVVLLGALADVVHGAGPTTTRSAALQRALAISAGEEMSEAAGSPSSPSHRAPEAGAAPDADHGSDPGHGPGSATEHGAGDFEVMYVLEAGAAEAAALRERLIRVGHAVAVVGQAREGTGLWQVHVHTDHPEQALSDPGTMRQLGVRYLPVLLTPARPAPVGVVACTRAPGLLAPLARTGAVAVLHADGAGIRRAVQDLGTDDVVVLPCDEASARAAGGPIEITAPYRPNPRVHRADCAHDVHVLAAAVEIALASAGQDPAAEESEAPAARALGIVEQVCAATRTGVVVPGPSGSPDPEAVTQVLDALLDGDRELVTVVVGAAVGDGVVDLVRRATAEAAAELVVIEGGQRTPALMMGAE